MGHPDRRQMGEAVERLAAPQPFGAPDQVEHLVVRSGPVGPADPVGDLFEAAGVELVGGHDQPVRPRLGTQQVRAAGSESFAQTVQRDPQRGGAHMLAVPQLVLEHLGAGPGVASGDEEREQAGLSLSGECLRSPVVEHGRSAEHPHPHLRHPSERTHVVRRAIATRRPRLSAAPTAVPATDASDSGRASRPGPARSSHARTRADRRSVAAVGLRVTGAPR